MYNRALRNASLSFLNTVVKVKGLEIRVGVDNTKA